MKNNETICTCQVKQNAQLIAKILDCDINGWTFGENFYNFVNEQREKLQEELESFNDQFLDEKDDNKRLSLKMAIGVLKRVVTSFDDVLYLIESLSQDEVANIWFAPPVEKAEEKQYMADNEEE